MLYGTPGETVHRIDLLFGNETEAKILDIAASLDYQSAQNWKSTPNNGQKMVTLYFTASNSLKVYQLFNFAHYGYEPAIEPIISAK